MQMTNQDYIRLANGARKPQDAPTRCFYAWMNDTLLARFNKGRSEYAKRLQQMVNAQATTYCPWSHVGKNH